MTMFPSGVTPTHFPRTLLFPVSIITGFSRWAQCSHHSTTTAFSSLRVLEWPSKTVRIELSVFSKLNRFFLARKIEVAPVGNSSEVRFTLSPIPAIAYTSSGPLIFVSMSIPASFFQSTTRSFGHFTFDGMPYTSSIPFRSVLATQNWRSGIRSIGIFGLIISENQRPPLGDSQLRPDRPLPWVWTSAVTTVHSAAPFSARVFALVFVDEILLYRTIFRRQPRTMGPRSQF